MTFLVLTSVGPLCKKLAKSIKQFKLCAKRINTSLKIEINLKHTKFVNILSGYNYVDKSDLNYKNI